MSAYLARLKQLENEKNSHYAPNSEPSKPSKAPFEPFEGKPPAHIEKNKHSPLGAGVVTPEAELRSLVNQVADYHGFTPEQRSEALEIALADQMAALECFRALAGSM